MRGAALIRSAVAAGGLLAAAEVCAQDLPDPLFLEQDLLRRPGNIDPLNLSIPRPEVEAIGVRLGGDYTLRASADAGPLLNSNVRVRPDGDFGVAGYVAPTVQITSNGESNPLVAYLAGSLLAYGSQKTETVGTIAGGLDVTREFGPDITVRAQAEGGRYYEDRALSFTPNLSYRPVKFERLQSAFSATATPGRLVITPALEIGRLVYHDGRRLADPSQLLIQRSRSYTRLEPTFLAGYLVSNTTALYGAVTLDKRDYDSNDRLNSTGYAAYGGVRFRPTALTRLDVAIGYQRQNYRPGLTDPKGLYARVVGLYSPDRLTRITVEYRRDISETGGIEVGGLTRDRIGVSVGRELLRNFRITGTAELRRYDFASIDRKDARVVGRLEGRYLAGRRFDLFARADGLVSRTSGAAGTLFDYERLTVVSGVALKL